MADNESPVHSVFTPIEDAPSNSEDQSKGLISRNSNTSHAQQTSQNMRNGNMTQSTSFKGPNSTAGDELEAPEDTTGIMFPTQTYPHQHVQQQQTQQSYQSDGAISEIDYSTPVSTTAAAMMYTTSSMNESFNPQSSVGISKTRMKMDAFKDALLRIVVAVQKSHEMRHPEWLPLSQTVVLAINRMHMMYLERSQEPTAEDVIDFMFVTLAHVNENIDMIHAYIQKTHNVQPSNPPPVRNHPGFCDNVPEPEVLYKSLPQKEVHSPSPKEPKVVHILRPGPSRSGSEQRPSDREKREVQQPQPQPQQHPTGSSRKTPMVEQKKRDTENMVSVAMIGSETIDTLSIPASSNNFSATSSSSNDDGCIVA